MLIRHLTPRVWDQDNPQEMFDRQILTKFEVQKYATKVISLYLNYFNQGEKPEPLNFGIGGFATGVWRKNPRMELVKKAFQEGTWLLVNKDGYEAVKDFFH